MNKKILEINNLSKHFENNGSKISVLNNINLKIETGKVIAIIGPSGSGKSTFLHLISLLDMPSKGKIKIIDTDHEYKRKLNESKSTAKKIVDNKKSQIEVYKDLRKNFSIKIEKAKKMKKIDDALQKEYSEKTKKKAS